MDLAGKCVVRMLHHYADDDFQEAAKQNHSLSTFAVLWTTSEVLKFAAIDGSIPSNESHPFASVNVIGHTTELVELSTISANSIHCESCPYEVRMATTGLEND